MLDVTAYGARGDRTCNEQVAIQAAIDACSRPGGGTVYLPAGDYLSGSLRLHSHVTLYLEDGVLRNIRRRPTGKKGQAPVVALHDCQHVQWET